MEPAEIGGWWSRREEKKRRKGRKGEEGKRRGRARARARASGGFRDEHRASVMGSCIMQRDKGLAQPSDCSMCLSRGEEEGIEGRDGGRKRGRRRKGEVETLESDKLDNLTT